MIFFVYIEKQIRPIRFQDTDHVTGITGSSVIYDDFLSNSHHPSHVSFPVYIFLFPGTTSFVGYLLHFVNYPVTFVSVYSFTCLPRLFSFYYDFIL